MKILNVNQKPQFGKELENMYSYTCMHMYVQKKNYEVWIPGFHKELLL